MRRDRSSCLILHLKLQGWSGWEHQPHRFTEYRKYSSKEFPRLACWINIVYHEISRSHQLRDLKRVMSTGSSRVGKNNRPEKDKYSFTQIVTCSACLDNGSYRVCRPQKCTGSHNWVDSFIFSDIALTGSTRDVCRIMSWMCSYSYPMDKMRIDSLWLIIIHTTSDVVALVTRVVFMKFKTSHRRQCAWSKIRRNAPKEESFISLCWTVLNKCRFCYVD